MMAHHPSLLIPRLGYALSTAPLSSDISFRDFYGTVKHARLQNSLDTINYPLDVDPLRNKLSGNDSNSAFLAFFLSIRPNFAAFTP